LIDAKDPVGQRETQDFDGDKKRPGWQISQRLALEQEIQPEGQAVEHVKLKSVGSESGQGLKVRSEKFGYQMLQTLSRRMPTAAAGTSGAPNPKDKHASVGVTERWKKMPSRIGRPAQTVG
jgi:hypothetical protein